MKKLLFVALIATFVLAFASVAFAVTPDASTPATFTPSQWTYQDLADASAKYEGGYKAFDSSVEATWYANPHGGYDTATNKCKVCHAVHRAEGAYYLLRADSQDDACDYCHIGGSAHSSKVVYDLNSAGKATSNGHTIGASTYIPDSSVAQWTEAVTLETVDANGDPLTEDIEVRAYDEQEAQMYRFARHHGHRAPGTDRSGYVKVGPLALRCMNCHQVHNAVDQVWAPNAVVAYPGMTSIPGVTPAVRAPYKLLKSYPSGATTGAPNAYGYYDANQAVRVPESTLTAGVNYSTHQSAEFIVAETGRSAPMWVAQSFTGGKTLRPVPPPSGWGAWESCLTCHPGFFGAGPDYVWNSASEFQQPAAVNNTAFSVWCADCHNLNIGYSTGLQNPELGLKAHTERTHPVPFVGGHGGPGQCYSCHRGDLGRNPSSCSQCHYGTGDYFDQRVDLTSPRFVEADFPHSGDEDSIKLLGSFSVTGYTGQNNGVIDDTVVITEDNLDAVCVRCHGGIGRFH